MQNLKIGQKVLIAVIIIFALFTLGLSAVIGTSSFNNLTEVKQAELARMSQILANRIAEMENQGVLTALSFEENEPIVNQIKMLTNLGPYYADPASYFAEDFADSGTPIEDADKIFVFQAQLELIQLLQTAKRINDLNSISFYLLSPFDVVPNAEPVLALRLDDNLISVTQFARKGEVSDLTVYQTAIDRFRPPAPDYFDISAAYSAPPAQFYAENSFSPVAVDESADYLEFPYDWQETSRPQSTIVVKGGVPVIETWYPVRASIAHPETWEETQAPVGLVLIEQRLDGAFIEALNEQLGLDVGLAQDDQLLLSSVAAVGGADGALNLAPDQTITVNEVGDYYYNQTPITLAGGEAANWGAVVLSPLSELEQLSQNLLTQTAVVAGLAIILIVIVAYISIQYLINRPLGALMAGVQTISAGNLNQTVKINSDDEFGRLATAFNGMAGQLSELVDSLEHRVAARTQRLEAVASLSERLGATFDRDQLYQELVEHIKESFGYYYVYVYMLDDTRTQMTLRAGCGEAGQQIKAEGQQIEISDKSNVAAETIRNGKLTQVNDIYQYPGWQPDPLLPETQAEMAVPIILDGQIVGVLGIQSDEAGSLDEADVSSLRSLANQVSVSIKNARLFRRMQAAMDEAESLNRQLTRDAWQNVEQQVESSGYVFTKTGIYPSSSEWLPAMEAAVEQQTLTQAAESSNGSETNDHHAATMAVPLTLRGEVIGAIGIERSGERAWSKDEAATMQTVTEQIALALDAARLARETERAAWRDRMVSESTARVWSSDELEDVLRTAVSQLGEKLGASEVVIRLGAEDMLVKE